MNEYRSFFRPAIDAMAGYTPGEQPKLTNLLKLNTNENPFPPSPAVAAALAKFDAADLRRYPDPMADELCTAIAEKHGVDRSMVIAGNGSDDVLTMLFRAFTDPARPVAILDPTYSLYQELAKMQEAEVIRIPLDETNGFAFPETLPAAVSRANLLIITRPNAPTGNSFPLSRLREVIETFRGVVFVDEAYADFADDDAMALVRDYSNLIVSRTSSKSYALAGLRFGYAVAHPAIIAGMVKLKDSYNLDRLTQVLATAAVRDPAYLAKRVAEVRTLRGELTAALTAKGYRVIPSQSNFLFAAPPDGDGEKVFRHLREQAVIVRYFPGPVTGKYLRITVGTREQNARLLAALD